MLSKDKLSTFTNCQRSVPRKSHILSSTMLGRQSTGFSRRLLFCHYNGIYLPGNTSRYSEHYYLSKIIILIKHIPPRWRWKDSIYSEGQRESVQLCFTVLGSHNKTTLEIRNTSCSTHLSWFALRLLFLRRGMLN